MITQNKYITTSTPTVSARARQERTIEARRYTYSAICLMARLCSTLANVAMRRPESLQNSEIIPNFVRIFEYVITLFHLDIEQKNNKINGRY